MERRDVGVAGISPAGELGLEVEVDELVRNAMNLKDVSPHCIGATVVDEDGMKLNQIIIKKGEHRSVSKIVTHYIMERGETLVLCDVPQSSLALREISDDRIWTIFDGEMELGPGAKCGDPIHVTFSYDTNGLFRGVFYYPRNSRTVEFLGEM
jgi:hypothetical protein